jgi:hypothetical protein
MEDQPGHLHWERPGVVLCPDTSAPRRRPAVPVGPGSDRDRRLRRSIPRVRPHRQPLYAYPRIPGGLRKDRIGRLESARPPMTVSRRAWGWPARSSRPGCPRPAGGSHCAVRSARDRALGSRAGDRRHLRLHQLLRQPAHRLAQHVGVLVSQHLCRPARPRSSCHVGHRGAPLVGTEAPTILSPR